MGRHQASRRGERYKYVQIVVVPVAHGYNSGYTGVMKTAVSIPDKVFRKADALAKVLEISRSELYAKALTSYVADHDNAAVTEQLNTVYADQKSALDPLLEKMQAMSLKPERW